MAGDGVTRPSDEELRAIRQEEPDPLGLMDVMELIAPEAQVTGWRPLPGGIDSIMHRIDVSMPSGNETGFVLRRTIPERRFDTDLLRLAQTLESLRPTPVEAPELLWLDNDGAVFGRPGLAMTLLPGRAATADALRDPAVVHGLADALVSLQWVTDLSTFDHLDVRPNAASLVARLDAWETPPEVPFADTAHIRHLLVEAAADLGPVEVRLCHGDFHIGNVLFDGAHPTGIVDWDGAMLADPRIDLAYAAMDLAIFGGLDLADTFLDAYESLRGPIADRDWWCLRVTATTWDDVASWLPGWHDIGVDIDLPTVHANLRAWTGRHLRALGS